jgi:hypothetical protein
MLGYGDSGAVSAKLGILDRHPPPGAMDRHGRATVAPLRRRIKRRISSMLRVESTWATKKSMSEAIVSVTVGPSVFFRINIPHQ